MSVHQCAARPAGCLPPPMLRVGWTHQQHSWLCQQGTFRKSPRPNTRCLTVGKGQTCQASTQCTHAATKACLHKGRRQLDMRLCRGGVGHNARPSLGGRGQQTQVHTGRSWKHMLQSQLDTQMYPQTDGSTRHQTGCDRCRCCARCTCRTSQQDTGPRYTRVFHAWPAPCCREGRKS